MTVNDLVQRDDWIRIMESQPPIDPTDKNWVLSARDPQGREMYRTNRVHSKELAEAMCERINDPEIDDEAWALPQLVDKFVAVEEA